MFQRHVVQCFLHLLTLKVTTQWYSKTSGTTHPMTQHHIAEDPNLQTETDLWGNSKTKLLKKRKAQVQFEFLT
jgi:hypothetical protein